MKNFFRFLNKLLLPSFLCIIAAYFTKENDYIFIASFVVIIVVYNLKKSKYNIIKTFLVSFLITFIVVSISIISYLFTGYITDLLTDNEFIKILNFNISLVDLTYLIQIALISPILFIFGYKFVFRINFTKDTIFITVSAVVLIFIVGFTPLKYENKYFFDIYLLWQIIMALTLQLVLYQKELKTLFKPKNGYG